MARDPDTIQREIEQTRAELADTIDAIADRLSPKRAASRGAHAVKAQVSSVLGGGSPDAETPDAAQERFDVATVAAEGARESAGGVRRIELERGGPAFDHGHGFEADRSMRTDRVLLAVGAAAAVAAIVVVRRSR